VLARLPLDRVVGDALAAAKPHLRSDESYLFVNGREVDLGLVDPFLCAGRVARLRVAHSLTHTHGHRLVPLLRREGRVHDQLVHSGLQADDAQEVRSACPSSAVTGLRYGARLATLFFQTTLLMLASDVRSPAVLFVNDLERDRQYEAWPVSLKEVCRVHALKQGH
jgi:hypothetical protein